MRASSMSRSWTPDTAMWYAQVISRLKQSRQTTVRPHLEIFSTLTGDSTVGVRLPNGALFMIPLTSLDLMAGLDVRVVIRNDNGPIDGFWEFNPVQREVVVYFCPVTRDGYRGGFAARIV